MGRNALATSAVLVASSAALFACGAVTEPARAATAPAPATTAAAPAPHLARAQTSSGAASTVHYQGLEVTVPDGDYLTTITDADSSADGSVVSCDGLQVHPVVVGTTGRQG